MSNPNSNSNHNPNPNPSMVDHDQLWLTVIDRGEAIDWLAVSCRSGLLPNYSIKNLGDQLIAPRTCMIQFDDFLSFSIFFWVARFTLCIIQSTITCCSRIHTVSCVFHSLPYILVYKSNFFGRENGLKKSTSTYIRENMRHTYRITKKCQKFTATSQVTELSK